MLIIKNSECNKITSSGNETRLILIIGLYTGLPTLESWIYDFNNYLFTFIYWVIIL